MIRAYDEMYLDDAMECLGAAVEHAVLLRGMDGQEFLDLFVASGVADEFGRGNVKYISGMSGIELARLWMCLIRLWHGKRKPTSPITVK